MTGPDPAHDRDDLALALVLDGRQPPTDADAATLDAHARARADVDLLDRMLWLIGETLTEEGPDAASDGPAADPVDADDSAAGGTVIPLFRRRPTMRMLGAAASVLAVLVVGTTVVVAGNHSGGRTEAAQAPAAPAGALHPGAAARAAPAAPAAAPAAAAPVPDTASGLTSRSSAAKATKSMNGSSTTSTSASAGGAFDTAVACARGILIGQVVSVSPSGGGYLLTLTVQRWISPGTGPNPIHYQIGSEQPTDGGTLTPGQRRLFIVPADKTAAVSDYPSPYGPVEKRIAQAQQDKAGQSCG